MGRPLPLDIKLTRTPLAGGGSTVVEQVAGGPSKRIKSCTVHLTQSVGNQSADIELYNLGGAFDSWSSGDAVRVEARPMGSSAYTLLVEGFIAEPENPLAFNKVRRIPVVGPNSILDLITLNADIVYDNTPWTTIYAQVCTQYLPGYAQSITTDAATPAHVVFPAGMKLREVLDTIRRSLQAATNQNWESVVSKNAGTTTVNLYKRNSTIQATLKAKDILRGAKVSWGSAYDLMNQITVYGATLPMRQVDRTTLTKTGTVRLDSSLKYVAQPFAADDTPLYLHQTALERSAAKDPPSLQVQVARNYDGTNGRSGWQNDPTIRVLRSANISSGSISNLYDEDTATGVVFNVAADAAYHECIVWDCGPGKSRLLAAIHEAAGTIGGTGFSIRIEGSQDDSSWTTVASNHTPGAAIITTADTNPATTAYRYFRLMVLCNVVGTPSLNSLGFLEYQSLATDPTTPKSVHEYPSGGTASFSTTGATTKELARFDFGSAKPLIKVSLSHSESIASSLITLDGQVSTDGSTWVTVFSLPSLTSIVVDTLYLEAGDYRYFRVITNDQRAAASPGCTTTGNGLTLYFHSATLTYPLPGDAMKGSQWTWTVDNLVLHPAQSEPHTFPAPRLGLVLGRLYWFVYQPQSGVSATSWWELDYGISPFPIALTSNLIVNPGFETYTTSPGPPDSWSMNAGSGTDCTRDTATLFQGAQSLKISSSAGGQTDLHQIITSVLVPGTTYAVSAYVKPGGAYPCKLEVYCDSTGLDEIHVTSSDPSKWTRIAGVFTAVAGRSYQILIGFDAASAGQFANFDSIAIEATGSALKTTDAGATWAPVVVGGVLLHKTQFNNAQVTGTATNAASQVKYANFVPGGVLAGSYTDPGIMCTDVATKIAASLVATRGDTKPRPLIPIHANLAITPGNRVTLAPDVTTLGAPAGDWDVMEHTIELVNPAKSTLTLNDHPPTPQDGALLVSSLASRGSL